MSGTPNKADVLIEVTQTKRLGKLLADALLNNSWGRSFKLVDLLLMCIIKISIKGCAIRPPFLDSISN